MAARLLAVVIMLAGCSGSPSPAPQDAGPEPDSGYDTSLDRRMRCRVDRENDGDLTDLDVVEWTGRALVRIAVGAPCRQYRIGIWTPGPSCPDRPPLPASCGTLETIVDEPALYLGGKLVALDDGREVVLLERAAIDEIVERAPGLSDVVLDRVELVATARDAAGQFSAPRVALRYDREGVFLRGGVVADASGGGPRVRLIRDSLIRPTWLTMIGRPPTDGFYESVLVVAGDDIQLADTTRTGDIRLDTAELR